MPLRAGQLGGTPVAGEMPWNGDILRFTYRPSVLTLEMMEQVNGPRLDGQTAAPFLAQYLLATLVDWDLLEDDGETPVPLTLTRIKRLDAAFLAALMQHLQGEVGLGESSARPRSGPSGSRGSKGSVPPKPASSRTRPTGMRTSRSRTGSA